MNILTHVMIILQYGYWHFETNKLEDTFFFKQTRIHSGHASIHESYKLCYELPTWLVALLCKHTQKRDKILLSGGLHACRPLPALWNICSLYPLRPTNVITKSLFLQPYTSAKDISFFSKHNNMANLKNKNWHNSKSIMQYWYGFLNFFHYNSLHA